MTNSVLLTSEGTYPHYHGGVSTWCDQMVRHASAVDFHLFSIAHSPHQPLVFKLPANVRSLEMLSLWGTEEPGCLPISFSAAHQRKLLTTEEIISQQFLPDFALIVHSIHAGLNADPALLGQSFHRLHCYFETYDYAATLTSQLAWECFKQCSANAALSLGDATICMRWLVRYLAITARQFPRTGLVHSSMAGLAAVPGVLCKLRDGIPFLLSEHGIHLRELYVSLSRMKESDACRRFLLGWNQAIVRMNYHYADHVTCLGEFNRKWQILFGADASKIEFVPNGVDSKRFFPSPTSRPPQLTVLTLARIYPLKGIDTLLRAAAIVNKKAPKIRFRIFGEVADQAYFAECKRIIKENKLQAVIEFGITKQSEKELQAAHVYCLPSVSEGLPYTLLEAMFTGCPVVSTDVGNIAETLNGTGLLVAPSHPEELAQALLMVLDGPGATALRDKLAAAALERARRRYTLEISMRPFLALYENLQPCNNVPQTV